MTLLEKKGTVQRQPHESDRRSTRLGMTDKGKQLAADHHALHLGLYTPHGLVFGFFGPRTGKADEKADEEVRASETKARFLAVQSIS